MSIDQHLIHTCVVSRPEAQADRYQNQKRVYRVHLPEVRCRLRTTSQRVQNTITGEWAIRTGYQLLATFGTDIQVGDRIGPVTLEDGSTDAFTYEVKAALPRRGGYARHLALELEQTA